MRSYGYTAENRLASATGSNLAHDALGRLFHISATNADFQLDGLDQIQETQPHTGTIRRRWVHGPGTDEPLVWYEGAGTSDRRYLHADERGSIVAVSDNAGNAISINKYDEYGVPASTNIGRFQYTGQKWIGEIGLYDYKNRMYNPALPRFMQTDPIGYGDGMNLYGYVGADPINFVDPSGLQAQEQQDEQERIIVTGIRLKTGSGGGGPASTGRGRGERQTQAPRTGMTAEECAANPQCSSVEEEGIIVTAQLKRRSPLLEVLGKLIPKSFSRPVSWTRRQLQSKFKHASEFGVNGSMNNKTLDEFGNAVNDHVRSMQLNVF